MSGAGWHARDGSADAIRQNNKNLRIYRNVAARDAASEARSTGRPSGHAAPGLTTGWGVIGFLFGLTLLVKDLADTLITWGFPAWLANGAFYLLSIVLVIAVLSILADGIWKYLVFGLMIFLGYRTYVWLTPSPQPIAAPTLKIFK